MFGGRAARAHTRTHARAQPISLPFLPPDSRFPMTDLHYLVPNRGFEEGSLQSLAYMAVARARGCNAIGWNNVPYKEAYTSHMQAPPGPFPPAGQALEHANANPPSHGGPAVGSVSHIWPNMHDYWPIMYVRRPPNRAPCGRSQRWSRRVRSGKIRTSPESRRAARRKRRSRWRTTRGRRSPPGTPDRIVHIWPIIA